MSQWKHISIAKLTMTNFKRFYGKHQIDLLTEPDIDRNLILIGGDNGRGKTSIHEAINYYSGHKIVPIIRTEASKN